MSILFANEEVIEEIVSVIRCCYSGADIGTAIAAAAAKADVTD